MSVDERPLPGRATANRLPGRPTDSATLADILERVLDKGIVIAGDIQINLLDIELLTIKLRLLIASVDKAKETISDLTGHEAESVTGMEWAEDQWRITVDVCELERIPNTTDVMASYEVELDENGDLVGYRRLSRFYRNQVDER